jgi:hypothetical protein
MLGSKIVFFLCGKGFKELIELSQEQELSFKGGIVYDENRTLGHAVFFSALAQLQYGRGRELCKLGDRITDVIYGFLKFVRCWRVHVQRLTSGQE